MITFETKGDWTDTTDWLGKTLDKMLHLDSSSVLEKYGQRGVDALSAATPYRTGKTSKSWNYEIRHENGSVVIDWYNENENEGENIALLIQYGHGTKQGAYIQGRDYINPAMRPIFDGIREEVWREVVGD